MADKNQSSSLMSNFNTTTLVTTGIPIVLLAGAGFYFYKQNNANLTKIQTLEKTLQETQTRMKYLEDLLQKQKEQLDVVVQNWQQAFGSIQNQMASISQPKYRTQAPPPQAPPPPQYSPDEEEFEEAPPQIKKKARGISQNAPSLKEQAAAMERERGG